MDAVSTGSRTRHVYCRGDLAREPFWVRGGVKRSGRRRVPLLRHESSPSRVAPSSYRGRHAASGLGPRVVGRATRLPRGEGTALRAT